jgi:hypothetical protein
MAFHSGLATLINNKKVIIQISPENIATLKKQKYSLYVLKASRAKGFGAPTIWQKIQTSRLQTTMTLAWDISYQGFISNNDVVPSNVITSAKSIKVELGNLIRIKNGLLECKTNGLKDTISYLNLDSRQYTVGVIQSNNISCAFQTLGKHSGKVIEPINKVALMFSNDNYQVATVITKAINGGACIDLEDVDTRHVKYNINHGWIADKAVWLKNFDAFTNISNLLIEPLTTIQRNFLKSIC